VYTPNQFFDVCVPHYSRGVVRLVAFMLRQTLGWSDAEGNPQAETVTFSYRDLIEHAGIGNSMIRQAIDEARAAGFIRCLTEGRKSKAGTAAVSSEYTLQWSGSAEYVKDPKRFKGFFAGEGNRTYIPNQFFDCVIPRETLSVIKAVSSIIRFSIGFQNKFGFRRQHASLSYQHIQNYAKISDRTTLSQAIRAATETGYIVRVEDGYFDRNAGKDSKAATYALKWFDSKTPEQTTPKTRPETFVQNHAEIPTGSTPKTRPENHSENQTDIKITQTNKTLKQQVTLRGDAAVAFERLQDAGFDAQAAQAIASRHPANQIIRQIGLLPTRNVKSNRLGMLRVAIEQNWSAPETAGKDRKVGETGTFEQAISAARGRWLRESNH
jgi:hypothetical protein